MKTIKNIKDVDIGDMITRDEGVLGKGYGLVIDKDEHGIRVKWVSATSHKFMNWSQLPLIRYERWSWVFDTVDAFGHPIDRYKVIG